MTVPWACFEVPEWGVFCHTERLRNRPPRLKLVLSDSTHKVHWDIAHQLLKPTYCWIRSQSCTNN